MEIVLKNKKIPAILAQTSLSISDQAEIRSNMSMFINHIDNTLSKDAIHRIVIEALGRDFLKKWNSNR
jgi:hypothetical protein